ncbi:hypothetical protein CPAR01_03680 [Colletotrichum paranaense]|uniref:Actin n=1 Tax=Colletotrichum paranaense TaxID=1914294 RepID=A0ABQ9SU71_9PEZI|nr:hypothetical protein CPAR01_03680 [Colletotrichum paranaense]
MRACGPRCPSSTHPGLTFPRP